jgi:hypothetical protein
MTPVLHSSIPMPSSHTLGLAILAAVLLESLLVLIMRVLGKLRG